MGFKTTTSFIFFTLSPRWHQIIPYDTSKDDYVRPGSFPQLHIMLHNHFQRLSFSLESCFWCVKLTEVPFIGALCNIIWLKHLPLLPPLSQTEYARFENGRFVYRISRSPMCEYMINFIHKLKHLPEKYMMNSVLENFTILLVRAETAFMLCKYIFTAFLSMGENVTLMQLI